MQITADRGYRRVRVDRHAASGHSASKEDPQIDQGWVASGNKPINPGWVALAEIVARISREEYHWPIRRKTFEMIAYFATESGIPTGLRYVRGGQGPYSRGLRELWARLLEDGFLREEKEGRAVLLPGPRHPDAVRVHNADIDRLSQIIDRVADLFLRLRPQLAALTAMIHFAARELTERGGGKPAEAEVLDEVVRWKQRRRPSPKDPDIASTIRGLNILGWISARPSLDLPVPKEDLLDD